MSGPPFIVGKPVVGEYFVDREEEMHRLLTLTRGVEKGAASNTVLIGLRRTGKTSILENLEIRLQPNMLVIPVLVNCYGMASKGRFAKVLVDKAVESYVRKTGDNVFLKRLKKALGDATSSALDRISELKFYEFLLKFKDKTTAEDVLIEDALQFIESLAFGEESVHGCYVG
jgi:AAA+ ATPase superfamily predicted ATPase